MKNIIKKIHKRTWVAIIIILILLPIVILTFLNANQIKAVWFNDNWKFRQKVTFGNTGAATTDQKVKLDIDTATLVTAGQLQSDCDDLRFTDNNGLLLRYYLDSAGGACNGASTDVYVLVPVINSGDTVLFMYFGNPSAGSGTESAQFSQSTFAPTSGPTFASNEASPSVTSWWKFDEGTENTCSNGTNDACDSSTNANDLAVTGATRVNEDLCASGKCYSYDGSGDYATISDDADLDFAASDDFTITAWFRHPVISTTSDYLIAKHQSATAGGYKVYMDSDGDLAFAIDDDGTWDPEDVVGDDQSKNYDDNKWHHFAAVKDGTTGIYIYVDGNLIDSDTSLTASGTLANAANYYVGIDADGSSNSWDGFIDEVKVYRFVKTEAQIKADATLGFAELGTASTLGINSKMYLSNGLVGYWKMNETSGNASDSSSNNHTLTNTGTATFVSAKYANGTDLESGSSQYFYIADNTTLSIASDLTITAWIKPESVTAATHFDIAGKWDGANESYLLAQYGDELRFYIDSSSNYTETSATNLTTGTFYHVTARYISSTSTAEIYVNGVLQAASTNGTIPASIGDDAGRFQIGAEDSTTSATNFYDGIIDDVRLFTSSVPINSIGNIVSAGPTPVAYWDLEKSVSATATRNGGMVVYADGVQDVIKYRIMEANGSWAAAAANTGDVDSGTVDKLPYQVKLYSSPAGNEKAMLSFHDDAVSGYLYGQIYNGNTQTWSNVQLIESGASGGFNPSDPWFDGTYLNDGRFMVINSDGTNIPQMSIWDGSSWSTVSTATKTVGGIPYEIVAKARPGSNEVMVATYDLSSDTNTIYYDGAGTATTDWSNATEHATDADNTTQRFIDFAWSQNNTLRGELVFEDSLTEQTPNVNVFTADGGGSGSWGTANDAVDTGDEPTASRIIDRPGTNEFIFCVKDATVTTPDINCVEESDNDTTPTVQVTTTGEISTDTDATSSSQTPFGIGYEQISGATAIAVYSDATGVPKLKKYDPSSNTWDAAATSLTTLTDAIENVTIEADPSTDDMAILVNDTAQDFDIVFWDGYSNAVYASGDRAQSEPSTANGSQDSTMPADFAWDTYSTGNTFLDKSGNGLTATLHGNLNQTVWGEGKFGKGLNFNFSSNLATVSDSSTIDFAASESFTVEAWVKHDGAIASNSDYILAKSDASSGGYKLYMDNSGDFCFAIDDDSSFTPDDSACTSAIDYDDSNWYHVVGVKEGTSAIRLFVNGVQVATDTSLAATGTLENAGRLQIGSDTDRSNNWDGLIDEIKIYNYARSNSQIIEDLNGGHPLGGSPISSQLVYWNFDDGYSTTANNNGTVSSSNGTLTNIASPATSTSGWTFSGKTNKAIVFDGSDDQVTLATASDGAVDFNGSEQFSISAWIYPTTVPTSTTEEDLIVGKWDQTSTQRAYRMFLENDDTDSTGNIRVEVYDESADQTLSVTGSNDFISQNTWYHVTLTFNGGVAGAANDLKLYLNGYLVGGNTANTSFLGIDDVTSDFTVGDYDATDATAALTAFTGRIDEIKIYSGVLSLENVQLDMNKGANTNFSYVQSSENEASYVSGGAGNSAILSWNLDENTGTSANDTSGNANTGTVTNTPTWSPGKYGSGIAFAASNQHVTIADDSDLDFAASESFSIETWFKHDTATATQTIAAKLESTGTDGGYKLKMEADGDITCETDDDDADTTIDDTATTTAATYDDNAWHHVVCVYDVTNTDLIIYIDGVYTASDTSTTTNSLANDDAFFYGIEAATGSEDWVGSLDNLHIYRYARSQSQVSYSYNRGVPVGWWKLDECTSTTANDSSGQGNTGTLSIGATGTYTSPGNCNSGTSTEAWNAGTTGKRNSGLGLDGTDDSISVTNDTIFDMDTSGYTIAGWVNVNTLADSSQHYVLNRYNFASNQGYGLYVTTAGEIGCDFNGSTGRFEPTTVYIAEDTWYHIACVWDMTNLYIYLNGMPVESASRTSLTDHNGTLYLGRPTDSSSTLYHFSGQIDDVRLYNYPLTTTQMKIIMNEGGSRFAPNTGQP